MTPGEQQDLFEADRTRSLLSRLMRDAAMYRRSSDYMELLAFVGRLRNFAPFNAMLLHIQKPGLSYAASERDWRELFGRKPKEAARPLVILWPFAPVVFVYDAQDTEGKPLPKDVASFFAQGPIDEARIASFLGPLQRRGIELRWMDAGDRNAGYIRVIRRATKDKEVPHYRLLVNRNHPPPVQFVTLAHELAHLLLGHLGTDRTFRMPDRQHITHALQELEAESVAFILCERNGVASRSETYLSSYVQEHDTVDDIDIHRVMYAAGDIEAMLGLMTRTRVASARKSGR